MNNVINLFVVMTSVLDYKILSVYHKCKKNCVKWLKQSEWQVVNDTVHFLFLKM